MKRSQELGNHFRNNRLSHGYETILELYKAIERQQRLQKQKWISYPYFQQIESLGRVPEIEIYLTITNFLNIPEEEAATMYASFIMPTAKLSLFFRDKFISKQHKIISLHEVRSDREEAENVYTFSDNELKLIATHPNAYDVAFALTETIADNVNSLSQVTKLSKTEVKKALELLVKIGVVHDTGSAYKAVKRTLRVVGNIDSVNPHWELNSRHIKNSHYQYYNPRNTYPSFRYSAVFPMTDPNADNIKTSFRRLGRELDALEKDPDESTRAYHILLMLAPRFNEGENKK